MLLQQERGEGQGKVGAVGAAPGPPATSADQHAAPGVQTDSHFHGGHDTSLTQHFFQMVASLAQKGGGRGGRTAGLPTLENNPINPTETEKNWENLDAGLPATHRKHTFIT